MIKHAVKQKQVQKHKKHFETQYNFLSRQCKNDSGLGKNIQVQLNVY